MEREQRSTSQATRAGDRTGRGRPAGRGDGAAAAGVAAAAALLAATGAMMLLDWCSPPAAAAISGGVVAGAAAFVGRARPATRNRPQASDVPPADASIEAVLKLKALELRLDERTRLLDAQADAVVLVDAHGETRHANLAARTLFGGRAATLGTRGIVAALPSAVGRAVAGVVSTACGERRRIEGEVAPADAGAEGKASSDHAAGSAPGGIPVSVHVVHVSGTGEPLAAVLVHDLRAERETDRLKGEFIARVNHELRTPLSSLRAYAEMLGDGELRDEAARSEAARIIISSTDRLSALVDGMLDISAIESGMARADFAPCDLAQLCDECVAEARPAAEQRGIRMGVARRTAGASAMADRTLVKQVVLNLLSNAVKYTPEGGRVEVEVDLDDLARTVVVSVRDTGLGVPMHAIPRLFGKFYRVAGHEKVAKGTGLGLNLCRNIVEELHGGQIGVESQLGEGSRFWFAIPLEQAGRKAA